MAKPPPKALQKLTRLAQHSNYRTRAWAARQALVPWLPPEVIRELFHDRSITVRYSLASNPNTPEFFLKRLCKSVWWDVRAAARKTLQDREDDHG